MLAFPKAAHAQLWTGASDVSDFWNQRGNWDGGRPPTSGTAAHILFGPSPRLTPIQNIADPFSLEAIVFDANAGPYVLQGSPIRLDGSPAIAVNTFAIPEIQNNLDLAANTLISGSAMRLSGSLTGAGFTQDAVGTLYLSSITNSAALSTFSSMSWNGGRNAGAGRMTVAGTLNTSSFENNGQVIVVFNGTVRNNSTPLVSTGGSRITINAGGTLDVTGNSLDLNGALLVNNGTITGTTNVNFGSLAKGSGNYGAVNVTDGGKFSPGNSPGTVITGSSTWNAGGSYLAEIGDASHDLWEVDGALRIAASAQHPFTILLASLDELNFDSSHDSTWPILRAEDGIDGWEEGSVILDVSEFKKSTGVGQFVLERSNTELAVHFSAVPEPAAMGLVLFAACVARRRRR